VRPSIEWKVSTHGMPSRRAPRTAAPATGAMTLACACATSYAPAASSCSTTRPSAGVQAMPAPGSRATRRRCTRTRPGTGGVSIADTSSA